MNAQYFIIVAATCNPPTIYRTTRIFHPLPPLNCVSSSSSCHPIVGSAATVALAFSEMRHPRLSQRAKRLNIDVAINSVQKPGQHVAHSYNKTHHTNNDWSRRVHHLYPPLRWTDIHAQYQLHWSATALGWFICIKSIIRTTSNDLKLRLIIL